MQSKSPKISALLGDFNLLFLYIENAPFILGDFILPFSHIENLPI